MSKYCISCGAANTETANLCTRCGKILYSMDEGGRTQKSVQMVPATRHNKKIIIIISLLVVFAVACVFVFQFFDKGSISKLTEAECEAIFSHTIQEEENNLNEIFDEEREHDPVRCEITDIKQDGKNATVTYKLAAKYNYADCDLICHCNCIFLDTAEIWEEGSSKKEYNWTYHDLEGVWEEKDWHQSWVIEGDSGPSTLSVVKTADGYQFSATDNWVDEYQDQQIEVKMSDLNEDTDFIGEGLVKLFPKGYQSEYDFQCYNLSPEEGITDMEKVE